MPKKLAREDELVNWEGKFKVRCLWREKGGWVGRMNGQDYVEKKRTQALGRIQCLNGERINMEVNETTEEEEVEEEEGKED